MLDISIEPIKAIVGRSQRPIESTPPRKRTIPEVEIGGTPLIESLSLLDQVHRFLATRVIEFRSELRLSIKSSLQLPLGG